MSFASLLIDVCTTQRYTTGAQDAFGKPAETWANNLVDEPCRLQAGIGGGNTFAGREIRVGAKLVEAEYLLFIGDVDITEQDRVVIDSVTYEVILVNDRQNGSASHHKECPLKTVR